MTRVLVHKLGNDDHGDMSDESLADKIYRLRIRRETVIKMIKNRQPESKVPNVREALSRLMADLRSERTSSTESLISALQEQLKETTAQIATELAFDEHAKSALEYETFNAVEKGVSHEQHMKSRRGIDFDVDDLKIAALDGAYSEQSDLLTWIRQAKGK